MFSWVVPGAMAERHDNVTDCRIADVVPAVTTVHGVRVPWVYLRQPLPLSPGVDDLSTWC